MNLLAKLQSPSHAALMLTAALFCTTGTAQAGLITAVSSDGRVLSDSGAANQFLENNPFVFSFDATANADAIIVHVSSEADNNGDVEVTFNGVGLERVVLRDPSGSRNHGIWFMNNPFAGIADLSIDLTSLGTVNGVGVGVVAVDVGPQYGSITPHASAISSGSSVLLDTAADNTFVVAGHARNGGGSVAVPPGSTSLYAGNIGSARGAAAYFENVVTGSQNYAFASNGSAAYTVAVAFKVPNPGTILLLGLGLTFVRLRRSEPS